MADDSRDIHSYGNPGKVRVRSVAMDLSVSFESKTLAGTAILGIEKTKGDPLVLDTRDLAIESVESSGDGGLYSPVTWSVGASDPILGAPLTVEIPAGTSFVRVTYASKPGATGLQWLTPEQTAGKKQPFLFSQNQSIHARSWIPIQDSPGVRDVHGSDSCAEGLGRADERGAQGC